MSTAVPDLSILPPPRVVEELAFESILQQHRADLLARHPDAAPVIDLESEPLIKLIESHAYREMLLRARINEAARAYLLAFAQGSDLDHKGAFYGLTRMLPSESDDRYRQRIQLRVQALAGNGTRQAYELLAMSASPHVHAARAAQPAPGRVLVLVWPADGADANAALVQVQTALAHDSARVLGVQVDCALARPRAIDITARIVRDHGAPADLLAQLAAALPRLLSGYAALGRDIARSWITARLQIDGVLAVTYPDPTRPAEITDLADDEYPVPGAIDLIDGGVAT